MVRSNHFASSEIQSLMDELASLFLSVKQLMQERSKKLEDSLKSQRVNLLCGSVGVLN